MTVVEDHSNENTTHFDSFLNFFQLEAHHKYAASTAEINRLKSEGAKSGLARRDKQGEKMCKGTVSISGLSLQLKPEFIRMISTSDGIHEDVHYFVCLVKYRSQVIASQMLSTIDGISRGGKLVFTNLININDLVNLSSSHCLLVF